MSHFPQPQRMSTLRIDHLRFVDKDTDALVHGYIHGIDGNTPKEIIQLCLIFYFQHIDQFDENACGKHIELQLTKNGLTKAKQSVYGWKSVCGSTIIDPDKMNNCIIKWKLKCYSINTETDAFDVFFSVGILSADESVDDKVDQYCFIGMNYKYYAWTGTTTPNDMSHYGVNKLEYNDDTAIVIGENTISQQWTTIGGYDYDFTNTKDNYVEMILDLKMKTLRWLLNDIEFSAKIKNIDVSQKYRLAVCLNNTGSLLEIVEFEIKDA